MLLTLLIAEPQRLRPISANYRADDNGGKELVNPVCAGKMNDKSNDDVNNTCNECADKNAEIAE